MPASAENCSAARTTRQSRCMELDSVEGAVACVDRAAARRAETVLDVLGLAWRLRLSSRVQRTSWIFRETRLTLPASSGSDVDLRGEPAALPERAAQPGDGLPRQRELELVGLAGVEQLGNRLQPRHAFVAAPEHGPADVD